MHLYRSTSQYPAYKHTSFNLEHHFGTVKIHLSFHVKYGYADRGFWFGLRPELEIYRAEDKLRKAVEELRNARKKFTCGKCGREKWGGLGLAYPPDWDFIHTTAYCDKCVAQYTYGELLEHDQQSHTFHNKSH